MKIALLLALIALRAHAGVAETLGNFVRTSQMVITGSLEFDTNARLGGVGPISMHLNRSQGDNSRGMSFSLSENT
jgi:hypothetical protein